MNWNRPHVRLDPKDDGKMEGLIKASGRGNGVGFESEELRVHGAKDRK